MSVFAIPVLWDGMKPKSYFVEWDETKVLFREMRQDQNLISRDGMESESYFVGRDGTRYILPRMKWDFLVLAYIIVVVSIVVVSVASSSNSIHN
jgi:hypothetical protein